MSTKDRITKDLEEIDRQVAELEAEKAGMPPVPTWEQLQDAGVVRELEAREARRGVLPHLLRAAKLKKLELQRASEEKALAPLKQRLEKAYGAMERAREAKIKTEEALADATGEWSDANMRAQTRETRIRHLNRQIEELQGEGQ